MTEEWNYFREVKKISRKMSKKRQNGYSENQFDELKKIGAQ